MRARAETYCFPRCKLNPSTVPPRIIGISAGQKGPIHHLGVNSRDSYPSVGWLVEDRPRCCGSCSFGTRIRSCGRPVPAGPSAPGGVVTGGAYEVSEGGPLPGARSRVPADRRNPRRAAALPARETSSRPVPAGVVRCSLPYRVERSGAVRRTGRHASTRPAPGRPEMRPAGPGRARGPRLPRRTARTRLRGARGGWGFRSSEGLDAREGRGRTVVGRRPCVKHRTPSVRDRCAGAGSGGSSTAGPRLSSRARARRRPGHPRALPPPSPPPSATGCSARWPGLGRRRGRRPALRRRVPGVRRVAAGRGRPTEDDNGDRCSLCRMPGGAFHFDRGTGRTGGTRTA